MLTVMTGLISRQAERLGRRDRKTRGRQVRPRQETGQAKHRLAVAHDLVLKAI